MNQNNHELILEKIKKDKRIFLDIPEVLKNNRDFIIQAVQNDGLILNYLSGSFRNDKEIVLFAVNQNGLALQYASELCKDDILIVLSSIKKEMHALFSASTRLKNHRYIIKQILRNTECLYYVKSWENNFKNLRYIIRKKNNLWLYFLFELIQKDRACSFICSTRNDNFIL